MLGIVILAAGVCASTGCQGLIDPDELEDLLEEAAESVNSVIDNLQSRSPYVVPARTDLARAGVIVDGTSNTIVIDEFAADVPASSLLASTFVAFTNDTGFDIVVEYRVVVGTTVIDDAAFVYDLETVLLGHPCADFVTVLAEYDFDPLTGEFIQDFQFPSLTKARLFDYECSDLLEFVFTPEFVDATVSIVDLVQ
jgi:hypothetical protein